MPPLAVFLLSSAVVVLAGIRLSRDGDTISERTGLGGAWIGAVLLAGATSLPELMTDSFAVQAGNVNMAISELFGSSMANMLILAVADLVVFRRHFLARVEINQTLVGVLAIALTAIAAAGVLTGDLLVIGPIGWAPALIVFGYLSGMRILHLNRTQPVFRAFGARENTADAARPREKPLPTLRRAMLGFAVAAAVILVASQQLADSAAAVAEAFGLTEGFVGVALVAITTSLPEVTVTITTIRIGAYDMAVGNLLGSNAFNMMILIVLDIVDGTGSVLARADASVVIGALFAMILTAQTVMEVLNRTERRFWLLEPDALLRIGMYALGLVLMYQAG